MWACAYDTYKGKLMSHTRNNTFLVFSSNNLAQFLLSIYVEFRKYFNDNYPAALEGFYRFSGFLGADIDLARKVDQASWEKSQTKSE